uniref:hypothetical protein n=1 Tax=Herbidospora sakaeratensis TaxID=564415 RepID=UPI000784576C|nr:hypothetical protein [Herbidospora sakaeratensis]
MVDWVNALCDIPLAVGEVPVAVQMAPARPHLSDRDAFLAAVRRRLDARPELVGAWQGYSFDKRTGAGPYLDLRPGSCRVGFYDDGFHDVTVHADAAGACADFIHREAVWVLGR